jgi:SP family sugar:H+ symporter-like MFS transporter
MGVIQELNPRIAFIGVFAALGALGFGYDNGWWGGVLGLPAFQRKYGTFDEAVGGYTIPAVRLSTGTGTGSAGVILGSLIAPWLCLHLGRKPTLMVMAGILTVGVVIEATAITSFWQLVVGRIIVYAGIGLAANVVPMYQSECAPAKFRGMCCSTPMR